MNSYSKNISLNSKGEMDLYLSSYGVRSIKEPLSINDKFLNEMVSCFIDNYEECFYYLSWINTYASNIQKFKSELKNELCDEGFILLLKRLKNLNKGKGIIDFDDGIIDFKDAKTRSFMNGGWLEVFIYREISKIKSVEDVSCGLKVDTNIFSNDYDVFDNELDIVFMANNKLHIIECKSGKISANSGNEILYKLDSLKKYGGLMTKVCFVSYSDIPYPVRKRAKNMGIEIIYGKQLKNTKLLIEEWILSRN